MIRRPPRSTLSSSSAASDVYKRQVFSLDDFRIIMSGNQAVKDIFSSLEEKYANAFPALKKEDIKFSGISNDQLAVISYTSGTTGFSKGVMITHNSLAANVRYAQNNMPLKP